MRAYALRQIFGFFFLSRRDGTPGASVRGYPTRAFLPLATVPAEDISRQIDRRDLAAERHMSDRPVHDQSLRILITAKLMSR
jgi:hypothetical protein